MIRLRKDYPKVPTGGWHFVDPAGVTLYGTSADDLIKNIAAFRLQNSLAPGSPEYEVTLFYVERYPDFVERTDTPIEEPAKTIEDRLTDWTNSLWRTPPRKLIPFKLATKRIETCMKCPHRRDWSAYANDDQNKEIIRKLIVLSQGYYRPDVGYCAAHKAHAGLLVLIKEPSVKSVPPECWIGKQDSLLDE